MTDEKKELIVKNLQEHHGGGGYRNLSRTYYSESLERLLVKIEEFIESDLADMQNENFSIESALKSIQKLIMK